MTWFARIQRLWALETFSPDIALARDESSHFLPWIIALMIYLAALTLAGGLTLNRTIRASQADQDNILSIHIPYKSEHTKELTEKTSAILRETPGVSSVSVIDSQHMSTLVEPWLGKHAALENLPLPIIIEAQIGDDQKPDTAQLKTKLQALAAGVEIEDHQEWADQFSGFVRKIQWMLFSVSLIIIGATAAMVVFTSRMSLKIHRNTVSLLHRLGAYDTYIAKQFQEHAAMLTLKGAFVGSGLAAGTLLILHIMANHINSPLFPSFAMTFGHWGILFALPFGMSVVALLSTRLSVMGTLGRVP